MNRHSGPSGISTTFATISFCPHSTAASTANAAASSSNGTSSVASMTGRLPEATSAVSRSRLGPLRLSVSISLRPQLPARRVPRRRAHPPPPHGQVEEEPDAGDDRDQVDEGVADDDDQNDERRDERQTQGDSL